MSAYYSENDPFAAAWLRELMRDGLIADGWVDTRDIWDVRPCDVEGFTQCHFFAGIGIWSLALRIAGWADDRPIWTGSAPCQPFSAAGKGDGFDDERHLWPAWYWLIAHGKRRDSPVLGEQVAAKAGRAWFDLVSSDMEALDHGCGAVDTSAASLGAPFIGPRLYWLAAPHSGEKRSREIRRPGDPAPCRDRQAVELGNDGGVRGLAASGDVGGLAASDSERLAQQRSDSRVPRQTMGTFSRQEPTGNRDNALRMAATASGQPRHRDIQSSGQHGLVSQDAGHSDEGGVPLHPTEYWRDADWLLCRDPNGARFRPVESSSQRMAYDRALGRIVVDSGGAYQTHFPLCEAKEYTNRLNEVRGFGNALNVSQAACFIEAVMKYLDR